MSRRKKTLKKRKTFIAENLGEDKQQFAVSSDSEAQENVIAIINEKNIDTTVIRQEPWPDDVRLFQPYETEQILLPDNANCLAVQAFLKMCNLRFTIEYRVNAEDMSPSGRVPFIKCGPCLVSDLEPITSFVANKGISLTSQLDAAQKSDMRAYMSLVNTVLGNAENYITWCDNDTYTHITKPRYGSVHPFPLNHILTYTRRKAVIKRLSALGWYEKNLDKVYEEIDRACCALSERLEKADFFFGDTPCELDALVFGHVFSILTTPSFKAGADLANRIRCFEPFLDHCKRIMPILDLVESIELPLNHKDYKSEPQEIINENEILSDPEPDVDNEFVYSESEHEAVNGDMQDYICLFNEKNTIYEAVFSPSKGNDCLLITQ